MSLSNKAVWEMRKTGSNLNGGFYKSDAGTTDYSQQDAAQLSLSDLVSDGAGTGISSATGGFTAQMVGNGFRIESTGGFTAGWYEITAYTDTNNVTIDRSAGLSKSGGSGKVGGAVSLPVQAILNVAIEAGNIIWIKGGGGDFVLTETISYFSKDGDLTNGWIQILGYNTTRGDNPTGTDRPKLDFGSSYVYVCDNYIKHKNLHLDYGGTASFFQFDISSTVENCYIELTTSGAAPRCLWHLSGTGLVRGCEISAVSASSGTSDAISHSTGSPLIVTGCYVHDYPSSGYAISLLNGARSRADFNLVDTCTNGIEVNNNIQETSSVINNTIYNCTKGIDYVHGDTIIYNNDINSCTTGINNSGADLFVDADFNNYYNNGTDVSGFSKGDSATAIDPGYADAPNGDFNNTLDAADAFVYGAFTPNIRQGAIQQSGGQEVSYGYVN